MKLFAIILSTVSVASFANNLPSRPRMSGGVTASSATSVIATTADIHLFVDPTGSDSNTCTTASTGACLTPQGAINAAPKMLRHQLTISLAAGTYAGFTISGFTVDPGLQHSSAGIAITGGRATSTTIATGTATGTATSGSAGSGIIYGTLIDSGATWTTNDLRGRLIYIVSGTGSGQLKRITTNTSTALTIAGIWTSPASDSVYAIQDPNVFITPTAAFVPTTDGGIATNAAGIQILDNNMPGARISIQDMSVTSGTNSINVIGPTSVDLNQVTFTNGGAFNDGSRITATNCWFGSTVTTDKTTYTETGNLHQGTIFSSTGSSIAVNSAQFYSNGPNIRSGARGAINSARVDCASAANSYGLLAGSSVMAASSQVLSFSGDVTVVQLDVTNCTVGMKAVGMLIGFSNAGAAAITGNGLSYGVVADWGGSIWLGSSSANTITGGTAVISLDQNTITGAFTDVASTGSCIQSLATNSKVCHL